MTPDPKEVYDSLLVRLVETRRRYGGEDSPEELDIVNEMDVAWERMSPEQRESLDLVDELLESLKARGCFGVLSSRPR